MSGMACAMCQRDECARCSSPNCLCCGGGEGTEDSFWSAGDSVEDLDYDYDYEDACYD